MSAIAAADFEFIRDLVHRRSAIVLDAGKEYLVESRLVTVARESGCADLRELVARLRLPTAGRLQQQVVEALTTNETSFFRDLHPFEALRRAVIPQILAQRGPEAPITIVCAACSSGQEPYSIALLLREHFPQLLRARIVATDLNTEVLARAREGRYSQLEVNRGLPASLLIRYFERCGAEWRLQEPVRKMVEFREMNLIAPWPPLAGVDIFFLRNVLIYFDLPTKKAILAKVRQALRPDGRLFLGAAETTLQVDDSFERVAFERTSYYRLRSV